MLSGTYIYYAKNYASILGLGLFVALIECKKWWFKFEWNAQKITEQVYVQVHGTFEFQPGDMQAFRKGVR